MSIGYVYGVDINDADYTVQINKDGKLLWVCPFYKKWKSLLQRCLSEKFKDKNPSYKDTSVCNEWLTFSNFRKWMSIQNWEGNELDKDYLSNENHYSPENCSFIPKYLNVLFTDASAIRGEFPIGVSRTSKSKKFEMKCSDGEGGRIVKYGFITPDDAYICWLETKINVVSAAKLKYTSSLQFDYRIVEVLESKVSELQEELNERKASQNS